MISSPIQRSQSSDSSQKITSGRTLQRARANMSLAPLILLASLIAGGCGDDDDDDDGGNDVTLEGSVMGSSLEGSTQSIAVHRLADTQLSAEVASLDLFIGEVGSFFNGCPDIGTPTDGTYLAFTLEAPTIEPGTYTLCDGFDCEGKIIDIGLFAGWQLPSGDTVDPLTGSAELEVFDGARAAGTFTFDFDGEIINGDFDMALDCTDDRPR